MSKSRDNVMTVHEPAIWVNEMGTPECRYYRDTVFTKQGIVAVYRQPEDPPHTRLHFVCQGKWYSRDIDGFYSDRRTITLARRFAEEIAQK
jgi:hypothetical protein